MEEMEQMERNNRFLLSRRGDERKSKRGSETGKEVRRRVDRERRKTTGRVKG